MFNIGETSVAVISNEDVSLEWYKRGKGLRRRRGPHTLKATMNNANLVEVL